MTKALHSHELLTLQFYFHYQKQKSSLKKELFGGIERPEASGEPLFTCLIYGNKKAPEEELFFEASSGFEPLYELLQSSA